MPVHVFTDALLSHVAAMTAGQKYHPLHKAVVLEPATVSSMPAEMSAQPLTMLFEGLSEWQDASVLLDSGQVLWARTQANFISNRHWIIANSFNLQKPHYPMVKHGKNWYCHCRLAYVRFPHAYFLFCYQLGNTL